MTNAYGTRDDCTRDNRQTICRNSMLLGYSTNVAKRGSWIVYEKDNAKHVGRVVGRVHCEGRTYLEIIEADEAITMAYVRWIDPNDVRQCYAAPHRQVIEFLMGEWKDADTVLCRAAQGFVRSERDAA